MKFIIDAQLPRKLSDFLNEKGFDSIHTLELIEKNKTKDKTIIEISIGENRIIITKDYDFLESFLLKGVPPKLLLIKTGNISNRELLNLFDQQLLKIVEVLENNNLIELHAKRIIIH